MRCSLHFARWCLSHLELKKELEWRCQTKKTVSKRNTQWSHDHYRSTDHFKAAMLCILNLCSVKSGVLGDLVGKKEARRRLNLTVWASCFPPWLQIEHFIFSLLIHWFSVLELVFINGFYCSQNSGIKGRQHDKIERALVWSWSFLKFYPWFWH